MQIKQKWKRVLQCNTVHTMLPSSLSNSGVGDRGVESNWK
jgi:hypothetical protein